MLIEQVDSYGIDLLAVQEIRWTGEGIIEKKNHTVVYSCDREKHMFGTGFILSKRIRPLLIDFDCRTPRLCKIRIKGIFFNYSFINFHAPTEDKDGAEKELFYEELHRLYNSCPKNDVKIFLGDANAKIGVEREFRPVIGGYSLHDISNDNGKRLIDFATDHNMVIPSTMFQHKRIHKMTWKSPNGNTYNQIDHILIDSRHKSDILDVRSYRGANIDSDHFLVLAEVRARISNIRKARGERLKKYDGEQLKKETTRKKFQEQIERRLEVTDGSSERDDVNREWNVIKRALIETGDQVVEKIERTGRKDWFDNDCFMATYKKNEAYKRMISSRHARNAENAYKEARREEKRIHKEKKRLFFEDLFENVEHLRGSRESRAFFREINLGRKEFKPRTNSCRSREGTILSDREEVLNRWNEHFDHLLNGDEEEDEIAIDNLQMNNQEMVTPPTLEEVIMGIDRLKNNKAPGPDTIPSELIKGGGMEVAKKIYDLILIIWEREVIPEDWKISLTCVIHKKGDVLECSNYRGINLLCTSYKVFSNILFNRLTMFSEGIIGEYQSGFRRGRSTTEQIFTIRQILEKTREFGIDLHNLFIDFKTAYDSINRKALIMAMREFEIPEKLVRLINLTLSETKIMVKIQNCLSEPLEIKNGVRQGDSLACLLFNIALEKVIRDSNINNRGTIFNKSIQLLAFADDIGIIARTPRALEEAFISLEKEALKMGLKINENKTKYMPCTKTAHRSTHLKIGGHSFEVVDSFTYLGSEINNRNDVTAEIRKRITAANRCFYGLRKFLRSNVIKRKTKLLLFKGLIRSVLTYACETWTLTHADEEMLSIFERKILRCIFGGINKNGQWLRRSNLELYRSYNEPDIIRFIKVQKIKWAGHLVRMEEDRIVKKTFDARPTGTRRRGRPNLRWLDTLERDLSILRIKNWKSIAKGRTAWKKLLEKAKAHPGLSSQ